MELTWTTFAKICATFGQFKKIATVSAFMYAFVNPKHNRVEKLSYFLGRIPKWYGSIRKKKNLLFLFRCVHVINDIHPKKKRQAAFLVIQMERADP